MAFLRFFCVLLFLFKSSYPQIYAFFSFFADFNPNYPIYNKLHELFFCSSSLLLLVISPTLMKNEAISELQSAFHFAIANPLLDLKPHAVGCRKMCPNWVEIICVIVRNFFTLLLLPAGWLEAFCFFGQVLYNCVLTCWSQNHNQKACVCEETSAEKDQKPEKGKETKKTWNEFTRLLNFW